MSGGFFLGSLKTIENNHGAEVLLLVVATQIFFPNFHPENLGKMIPFDEHIFQMGWFNHNLVFFWRGITKTEEKAIFYRSMGGYLTGQNGWFYAR